MTPTWRLLIDDERPGAENMAVDRAILSCRAEGIVPPTLRLYRWRVPTVSLGRFQRAEDVDLAACERRGLEVVRRPTGGRGVLHDDEVTYSITAGVADGVPRGTAASYRHLCSVVASAYALLGVPAQLTARPRGRSESAACYLHATVADLSLGTEKLSGSAQVWNGDTVLQHGSFVVSRDCEAEAEVFGLDGEAARDLEGSTATLSSALGRRPSSDEIADAVVEGLARALNVRIELGDIVGEESARVAGWIAEHEVPLRP